MPDFYKTRSASPAARTALLLLLTALPTALPCFVSGVSAQPPASPSSGALVRRSDFIGIVQADPIVGNLSGPWRQMVSLSRVEPIKSDLSDALLLDDRRLLALADNSGDFSDTARFSKGGDYVAGTGVWAAFPSRFPRKGEYLVFLRRDTPDAANRRSLVIANRPGSASEKAPGGREIYGTLAVFPVETRTGADGKPVRTIVGGTPKEQGTQEPQALDVQTVRALLGRVSASLAKGESAPADAAEPLDRLFRQATRIPIYLYPLGVPRAPKKAEVPHETRLREVKAQAASIRPGMTRAEVEALFPTQDGGLSASGSTRYYGGSEVMIEVPYDQNGGAWKPQNRVTGPVRVYRSRLHVR